jgi:hypothetical protein
LTDGFPSVPDDAAVTGYGENPAAKTVVKFRVAKAAKDAILGIKK